ncbi:MAG: 16S rRNA (guanine(527)-N(7))-methyltransferase RsmG [Bacteroidetes bacterium]|nr:16S rRNA (guanine(527)-N(7))-methyltransferase RsmG [Bacteroidota bacterium]
MEIIKKYFNLTLQQEQSFAKLKEIYASWNERINVISRKDIENLYERHILHSLGIAKVLQFKKHTSILDVGTGGGFPGIPLAIMFPECSFTLVDSIGKKITVVNAVIEELELTNTKAFQTRAENINGKFDFIVSRAVTELPDFYEWVKNKIIKNGFNNLPNGILYLKGGDIAQELLKLKTKNKIFGLKDFFDEEFFETKKVVYLSGNC